MEEEVGGFGFYPLGEARFRAVIDTFTGVVTTEVRGRPTEMEALLVLLVLVVGLVAGIVLAVESGWHQSVREQALLAELDSLKAVHRLMAVRVSADLLTPALPLLLVSSSFPNVVLSPCPRR